MMVIDEYAKVDWNKLAVALRDSNPSIIDNFILTPSAEKIDMRKHNSAMKRNFLDKKYNGYRQARLCKR